MQENCKSLSEATNYMQDLLSVLGLFNPDVCILPTFRKDYIKWATSKQIYGVEHSEENA